MLYPHIQHIHNPENGVVFPWKCGATSAGPGCEPDPVPTTSWLRKAHDQLPARRGEGPETARIPGWPWVFCRVAIRKPKHIKDSTMPFWCESGSLFRLVAEVRGCCRCWWCSTSDVECSLFSNEFDMNEQGKTSVAGSIRMIRIICKIMQCCLHNTDD